MMVRGPGQKAAASFWALSGTSLTRGASSGKPADVDDQRVIRGAALGLVDFLHGLPIQGVGGQAVDRLRGDGHQAAPAEDVPRPLDVIGAIGR